MKKQATDSKSAKHIWRTVSRVHYELANIKKKENLKMGKRFEDTSQRCIDGK